MPIVSFSGIYYEKLQSVFFYNNWDLVSYLDLNNFEQRLYFLESIFKKLVNLCQNNLVSDLTICHTNLKMLYQIIPSVFNKEQTLKTLIGHKKVKRALLNIVGTAFKSLFGTMDEEDSKYYNEAINKVNSDEKEMLNLFKQQIQVTKSTITNFNRTITDLNNNKHIFEENFEKLKTYINQIQKNHFHLNLKQTIEEQFSLLILMLNEIENDYSSIIDSILFTKSNSVHPYVMSPEQLIIELTKTLPFLPSSSSYTLPLDTTNAYKLINFVKVKCFFENNRIIYVISNPLINNLRFTLFNLVPLPSLEIKKHYSLYYHQQTI